jgi:hypothetical protein
LTIKIAKMPNLKNWNGEYRFQMLVLGASDISSKPSLRLIGRYTIDWGPPSQQVAAPEWRVRTLATSTAMRRSSAPDLRQLTLHQIAGQQYTCQQQTHPDTRVSD